MTAFKLFGGSIHSALIHAATRHDDREAKGKRYNPYALAQYLRRIDDIEADIAKGASPKDAIMAGTHGTLRSALLRAVGENADHSEVRHGNHLGMPTYKPASDRS